MRKIQTGQTYLEYTLILTAVLGIIMAMTPMIKRVLQGMIIPVADQLGRQPDSDQSVDQRGIMLKSAIRQQASTDKAEVDYGNYVYNDTVRGKTSQVSDLGFTPSQ